MSNKIRVLGIDCGTAITGWSVLERVGSGYTIISSGVIINDKTTLVCERLKNIYEKLREMIEKYKPNTMAVETIYFFKNNKTVISVSEARGVILLAGMMGGLEIFNYTPLQVKTAVTGYGRAEKKQVQFMVQKILGLKEIPKPDDLADAYAIGICHLNSNFKIHDSKINRNN